MMLHGVGQGVHHLYLLAPVEVVATYQLHNLNRVRLENIFHRLFGATQLDLTI